MSHPDLIDRTWGLWDKQMLMLLRDDIVGDQRRATVMTLLLGYGARIPESVYACALTAGQSTTIYVERARRIDLQTDSVCCAQLDRGVVKQSRMIGPGTVMTAPPEYLV